jgi:hypothetical protein
MRKKTELFLNCPKCGGRATRVTGAAVYPHRKDLKLKKFHQCKPCDYQVGCHGKTWKPLGEMAGPETREARKHTHYFVDRIWKRGFMTRPETYTWLSQELDLPKSKTHIALFDTETCGKAQDLAMDYLKDMGL